MINKRDAEELIARNRFDNKELGEMLIKALDKCEKQDEVINRLLAEIDGYKRWLVDLIKQTKN
jgi:hypothetical protein